MSAENPAVPVGGILAHTDIGNHIELRKSRFDVPDCPLHNAVRLPCAAADLIFLCRNAEEQHALHAGIRHLMQNLIHSIQTPPILSGHGGNLLLDVGSLLHKHGIDQRIRRNPCFPYHAAKQRTAAQTTGTIGQIHCSYQLSIELCKLPCQFFRQHSSISHISLYHGTFRNAAHTGKSVERHLCSAASGVTAHRRRAVSAQQC